MSSSPRCALITGITGQDGSYLAELLLEKGYRVVGVTRRTSSHRNERIAHLEDRLELVSADLLDQSSLTSALADARPHEVYNLAAQSFVPTSWSQPVLTAEFTAVGVTRLLEAVRAVDPTIRFYQASSSEMFGKVRQTPQNEATPFHPRSPYGVAKCYGHWITVNYRESYGLFACSGILFNHECVTAETPVFVRRGELLDVLPIADLVPHRSDPAQGLEYSGPPAEPLEIWDRGGWTRVEWTTARWNDPQRADHRPVRRVAAGGACFSVTGDHVVFAEGARETPSRELREGAALELLELPDATDRTPLSEDEAWFLGAMAAAGVASDGAARFVSGHEERVAAVRGAWERLTGGSATARRERSGCEPATSGYRLDLCGAPDYCRWLRAQLYTPGATRRVPLRVLNAPSAARRAFLKGYQPGGGSREGHGASGLEVFEADSAVLAQGLWWLAHRTHGERAILSVEDRDGKVHYRIEPNAPAAPGRSGAGLRRPLAQIVAIEEGKQAGWLFDLATASGTFQAGVGAAWMHNSPRRGLEFVTRKVTDGAARIALGLASELQLGNLEAKRDWGFAGDYVDAMWRMLQQPEPDDYVIATGETHTVRELVEIAFERAGLEWQRYVREHPRFMRPAEVDLLLGDASKARERLGWRPRVRFRELVERMVDADLERLRATR